MSTSRREILKAAGLLMAANVASRVLGMVRDIATTQTFGSNWRTDAYFAAFGIPDLMYMLVVGGGLSAAFIPVFSGLLATRDEKEAWKTATSFLMAAAAVLVGFTLLGITFARELAPLVAYNFRGEQLELFVRLTRMMFPAVFFTSMAGLAMGVHFSYQRFWMPALGPIVYNIAIILSIYVLGPRMGVQGMAVGVFCGAVSSFALQVPFVLRQSAGMPWKWDLGDPGLRRIMLLMVPTALGLGLRQMNTVAEANLASGMGAGAITAVRYATRLYMLPIDVFGSSLAMAVYPVLARQAALGQQDEFRQTLNNGLRNILFVTLPAAVGMAVLAEPIVRLLFQHGLFTAADTRWTATTLMFYTPAVVAQSAMVLFTRAFYAQQDTRTPVLVAAAMVLAGLGINIALVLTAHLGTLGLATVSSITSLANVLILAELMRRRQHGIGGRHLAVMLAKGSVGAAVLSGVAWAVAALVARRLGVAHVGAQLIQVLASVGGGVAAYVAMAWLLKMEELQAVLQLVMRRLGRDGRSVPPADGSLAGSSAGPEGAEPGSSVAGTVVDAVVAAGADPGAEGAAGAAAEKESRKGGRSGGSDGDADLPGR